MSSSGEEEGTYATGFGAYLRSWSRPNSSRSILKNYKRLDAVVVQPLQNEYAHEVNVHTNANNIRLPSRQMTLRSAAHKDKPDSSNFTVLNTASVLAKRELHLGGRPGLSTAQQCHLCCYRNLPKYPQRVIDRMGNRAYIGQFSGNGALFIAAFQDKRLRVYDVERDWRLRKDIEARLSQWTITDTSLSPDQRFLIYASMTPVVHLVAVGSAHDEVSSISNITDIHEPLLFAGRGQHHFGIYSVAWSGDGQRVLAGTSSHSVLLYDIEAGRVVAKIAAHDDDVNAVTYADNTPNIMVSGSDDSMIKVWDRRTVGNGAHAQPAGLLVGHTEGLTHLDPRGDGRYLLSNAKDQTAKLWDLRNMVSQATHEGRQEAAVPRWDWDYRRGSYPGEGYDIRHPYDQSLMTFRGHGVLKTLIRAYFSPAHTTGQRYVYSASYDGSVHIWDSITGQRVEQLKYHRVLVRDCSWHPTTSHLATVSWDGSVVLWGSQAPDKRLPGQGGDVLDWY